MSLRIVPTLAHPHTTPSAPGAPSAPGVHDTLRSNLSLTPTAPPKTTISSSLPLQSTHPLEARLSQWRSNQDALKMNMLRRTYGIAEPVRRGMEMAIVRAGEWRPMCLGVGFGGAMGGVHADILSGRDCELDWEDVFGGEDLMREVDFHAEMEVGMGW